ncbi:MFS transporter [Nocardioides sp. 503]|uniref:MFS transporter n=1 Tax=Nocardioides sp. 503 TaxID=2508326 RepID=UPI001ADCA4FF|nr:MFS transporter [Nocardioides sp. 503]
MTSTATSPDPATGTPTGPPQASWAGVVSLGLGIFAIVMSEFLPASLLPRIAEDLRVSEGAAGQAVTTTAIAGALAALLISVVLPRADRRTVMMGLTALAAVSNLLVALAPNLAVLLAARLLLGVALGGFWAMATATASQLVPADHLGRALTVVNSGVALATVAAVPLGSWLGEVWGWREVFVLGAGVAVVALVVQAATLPHVAASASTGLRALGATLRSPVVLVGLFAVLVIFAGHFSGFTYIRPATESLSDLGTGALAGLLLVFGIANFAGTAVSGPLADRAPQVGTFLFPGLLGAGMVLMYATGSSETWLFVAAAVWGFGFGGVPTTVLSWGARAEPDRLEQVGGVIVTACNLAIALGAIVGGALVDGTAADAPLLVGGVAAIVGALTLTSLRTKVGA